MVIIESMACGTPVISYNRGAASELIRSGKNGFLVKNRKEMVKAITRINTIRRKDCRTYIEEKFSPKATASKHIAIYQKEMTKKNLVERKNVAEDSARSIGLLRRVCIGYAPPPGCPAGMRRCSLRLTRQPSNLPRRDATAATGVAPDSAASWARTTA